MQVNLLRIEVFILLPHYTIPKVKFDCKAIKYLCSFMYIYFSFTERFNRRWHQKHCIVATFNVRILQSQE